MCSNQSASQNEQANQSCVVEVQQVSKCFHLYDQPIDRLKQFLWRGRRQFFREFWALRDVSFRLKRGESIGFIGRNGSGKSTLLQIIAGTLGPSSGVVATSGRVAALLELGAGFNPEFTGRENVRLNAALLGLSPQEIEDRFEQIAAFAELGSFIDQPVKTYSSGMYVRLAFAVSVHVDPEVLIVDEALAVGDAPFQFKCMSRIEALREKGTSILFVSHDSSAVKRLCDRAGWLHEGNLIALGDAVTVANQYEDFVRAQTIAPQAELPSSKTAGGSSGSETAATEPSVQAAPADGHFARVVKSELRDYRGSPQQMFVFGSGLTHAITYQVHRAPERGFVLGAAIFRNDHLYVCGVNTLLDKAEVPSTVGTHTVSIHYDKLGLLPGSYYFKVGLFDHTATIRWDFIDDAAKFTIVGPYVAEGVSVLPHHWSVEDRAELVGGAS